MRIEGEDDSLAGKAVLQYLLAEVCSLSCEEDGGMCCAVGALCWIVATYVLVWQRVYPRRLVGGYERI